MMKIIKLNFLITAIIYFAVYLIRIFIQWKIINPFDWIIAMPTYSGDVRGLILFFYAFYQIVLAIIVVDYLKTKKIK